MTELEARSEIYLANKTFGRLVSTSGWDPEIFVTEKDGTLIPAFEFLPPKCRPIVFEPYPYPNNGGYTQTLYHDGFAAEWTTRPSGCHQIGIDQIRRGMLELDLLARKHYPGSKLTLQSFYRIPDLTLRKFPLEQIALGCKPSLNAYDQAPVLFDDPIGMPYRMAGGHIHFALNKEALRRKDKLWDLSLIVKFIDLFCALPCVALFDGIDFPLRRSYYGRAGEYRATRYGLEYRVLSNAWLADPHFCHLVMNMARAATSAYNSGVELTSFGLTEEQIQQIINNADATSARAWIKEYWPFLEAVMMKEYYGPGNRGLMNDPQKHIADWWTFAFTQIWPIGSVLLQGMKNHLKKWDDIPNNWQLGSTWNPQSNSGHAQWKNYVGREMTIKGCFNLTKKEEFLHALTMSSM